MSVQDILLRPAAPLSEAQIRLLAERGLRLVARLPDGSYRLRGESSATAADLIALDFVHTATAYDPAAKLDPSLAAASAAAAGVGAFDDGGAPVITALASIDPAADPAATTAQLESLGTVVEATSRRVVVRTTTDRLADIAALDGVLHVEINPDTHTQNNVARILTKIDSVATTLGLDGAGEIVGVADSGLDTGVAATVLPDFRGRIVNIRASVVKAPANGADLNNHGTHVAGSILGDGASSNGQLRGMAPAARLTMLAMGPNNTSGLSVPPDLVAGVFTDAYNDGARIHSNSWGSNNSNGRYTAFSEDVDDFVFRHPDLLVVVAAGNAGPGASTVLAPGTAKNCLTVGAAESVRPLPSAITIDPNLQDDDHNPATPKVNVPLTLNNFGQQADNADDIAGFSSRGPVNDVGDNRTKPDIVAPGTFILSCRSSISTADTGPDGLTHTADLDSRYADDANGSASHAEAVGRGLPGGRFFGTWNQTTPPAPAGSGPLAQQNYFYSSGTSMATPITSGAMALLRQYLRQRRGLANPSAALLKAMVINAATVPAGASNAPNNTRGFGWLNLDQLLAPPPTGQQVFVDDAALAVATGDVRRLAVQVADPGRPLRVTLVWTDSPGRGLQNRLYLRLVPPGDGAPIDGDIVAFPNPRNNVQRIHVAAPAAGEWTVEVHGIDVPFAIPALAPTRRQDFALAISNAAGFSPEPIDLGQVVDTSASMGTFSFITPVRERTKELVDTLRVNDRAGVVTFDGSATTVAPAVPITDLIGRATVTAAIDAFAATGASSIGAGLQQSVADLAAGGGDRPQAIVLVSDGHENTPPWVGGGLTNSPPAWFGGVDRTEVLPTVPAGTTIHTVALGVAADAVLLQEIAAARGGRFQSVPSAAETGRLHEIYLHLQALVSGEEMIAAGRGAVDGVGTVAADPNAVLAAPPDLPELTALLTPESGLAQAILAAGRLEDIHTVQVDDTVGTVTFVLSWHDPSRPVHLDLLSPSLQTITPASTAHRTVDGSSYRMIRVERPEPGPWQLRVSADGGQGTHGYTWGARGTSPIGLRLTPPDRPVGRTALDITAELVDPDRLTRRPRFAGQALMPTVSVDELVAKHRDALDQITLAIGPDTPALDPNLSKLLVLELQRATAGGAALIETRAQKLALTGRGTATTFRPAASGTTAVEVRVAGATAGGQPFTRIARCDVHC